MAKKTPSAPAPAQPSDEAVLQLEALVGDLVQGARWREGRPVTNALLAAYRLGAAEADARRALCAADAAPADPAAADL